MVRFARMNAIPSRSWPNVGIDGALASCRPARPWRASAVGGGTDGRVIERHRGQEVQAATTRTRTCGLVRLTTSGPSSAKPRANAAFRVRVKIPFAARSWPRLTRIGIIAASAGAKNVVTVETIAFRTRIRIRLSPMKKSSDEHHRPQEVGHDQDQAPVEAVDVDPGNGREQDRRHEERQDQEADRRGRAGQREDPDGQPEQDHVAADLGRAWASQRRRNPRSGGPRADRPRPARACRGVRHASGPRVTNSTQRARASALQQDVAAAGAAAQADVGTEPIDRQVSPPHGWVRRSRTTSPRSSGSTG